MNKTISNDFLTVTINSLGAEIVSIKTKDGTERLWQAEKTIWARQAPILFPWTGRIVGKAFSHKAKYFDAPIHGFLHSTEHSVKTEEKNAITFSVNYGKNDYFPFSFCAEQTFELSKETLTHSVKIINTSTETMPFGLGFHPGFICPFSNKNDTNNYSIHFDTPQTVKTILMTEGHPNGEKEDINLPLQLSNSLFNNDSICLANFKTNTITLLEENTENKIVMTIDGFPYVLLWSATTPTLQFICIEPWNTLPDYKNPPTEWTEKQNLLQLKEEENFMSQIAMSFYFNKK